MRARPPIARRRTKRLRRTRATRPTSSSATCCSSAFTKWGMRSPISSISRRWAAPRMQPIRLPPLPFSMPARSFLSTCSFRQRGYQIICVMVGSDQEQFRELADRVRMARDRQRTCANDYEDAKYAWHSLLESHRRADGEPTATIEIAYEAGQGNLKRYARSFQSVALLEALSDYASSRYALPRPIKIVMASCGDANAAWVSSANPETLCYELADDFFDLYEGFTTYGKVQDHGLVSKNVARISLAHNASAGTLA